MELPGWKDRAGVLCRGLGSLPAVPCTGLRPGAPWSDHLGSRPASATYQLCDFGQVVPFLHGTVSPTVYRGDKSGMLESVGT